MTASTMNVEPLPEFTPRLFYSVQDAMTLLDMGRTELYQEIRSGRLKSVKRGRRRQISHDALLDYYKRVCQEAEHDEGR